MLNEKEQPQYEKELSTITYSFDRVLRKDFINYHEIVKDLILKQKINF